MRYTHHYLSPLGGITIASDGSALTGLWFDGQKYFGAGLAKTHEEKSLPIFDQADRWFDLYFSGRAPDGSGYVFKRCRKVSCGCGICHENIKQEL